MERLRQFAKRATQEQFHFTPREDENSSFISMVNLGQKTTAGLSFKR
jgi:hypothetical protein